MTAAHTKYESDHPTRLKPSDIAPFGTKRVLVLGCVPTIMDSKAYYQVDDVRRQNDLPPVLNNHIQDYSADSMVIGQRSWPVESLYKAISALAHSFSDNGRMTLLFNHQNELPCSMSRLDEILNDNGLIRYQHGALTTPDGNEFVWGIVAVKSCYNPVIHARQADAIGRPDCGIAILDTIPGNFFQSNDLIARIALEKQQFYLNWQKMQGAHQAPHALFSKERREFAQVTELLPELTDTYHIHADFWNYLGRSDMAQRVLRSIGHSYSKPQDGHEKQNQIQTGPEKDYNEAVPLWDPINTAPRILVITHDYLDYGMDTLYHGLCTLLGKENVIEFPWKPTLHGKDIEKANNCPCVFNYPGDPLSVERLKQELYQGKFDLILYADVVQQAHGRAVRRLLKAGAHLPVILYDTWDDCYTPLPQILKHIGRSHFDVLFKREMLAGVDYGEHTYPLPFGYAENFIHPASVNEKSEPLFWAGKNEYGLRPLYIRSLEKRLGYSLDRRYSQNEYKSKLVNSEIGLSFFGCSFDSVRYWELPANGVMLMAERPPIQIPHNFEDGRNAVFFDDLPEMEEKLDYYLRNPKEVSRIASAGHAHYLKHHTTLNRARQFLGIVDRQLNGRLSKSSPIYPAASYYNKPKTDSDTINLGLVRGENYGWGVCSKHLIEELSKSRSVHVLNEQYGSAFNSHLEGKLVQALTTVELGPLFEKARADQNFGYTFFEEELNEISIRNARQYDLILAGSTWCRDRMLEKGITNCEILIQGIDPKLFYPIKNKKSRDQFVIFSGGKFELRKGQDLVLRAVKVLQDKYPDVFLMNCWYNLWPQSVSQMANSPYIQFNYRENDPWIESMQRTYLENGLDPNRIITLELVPHHKLRELFQQTDIGVFPNRCEGGTNLVLMEYMACAKPVIASHASGHKDIITKSNALLLNHLKEIKIRNDEGTLIGRWKDPSLEELVEQLEYAYHHRDEIEEIGCQAGRDLQRFTWKRSAEQLLKIIDC